MKYGVFVCLFCVVLLTSCNNDDNGPNVESVPPRLLSEVAIENDEEIQEFLKTHFYNYEEFETPSADFDFKIRIDTIAGDNADKTPLIDQVNDTTVTVSSNEFLGLDEEEDVKHKYYYLEVRTGSGEKISVADSSFVRYEGKTLNLESFDGSVNNPVWFDLSVLQLPQTQIGAKNFRGFAEGVSKLRGGGEATVNEDGTITVDNYGIGFVIFPSGLGNFNNTNAIIPQYGPLIFFLDLFIVNTTDHDGDGVPSIDEDVNGNGFLYDDNTDFQSEVDSGSQFRIANFQDPDDDGDGKPTREEISDSNGNIIIPYPDSNNDGTPDYLDPDVN